MLALRPDHRKSLPPFVPALASPKAEPPPQCAELPPRCAEQPPRSEQRQQQQQPRTKGEAPRRVAAHHGSARSNKQQTLSDAQAIQRGTVGGTDGTGTSTPFWVEAGMRTAINRLCSVVLYAVGTGQLDLLHKCEASADQLQAHFRIPPWQMSAVHRHVTTGIWLLTNSGTDGLPPDQAKEYGEPEAASTPPTRLVIDPQEWDLSSGCAHLDVPGEAGKMWAIATVPHEARADAVASRQRRSRRAWSPDASMDHAVQESRKSRTRSSSKRSRRDHPTNEFVHVKSRRRHRRNGRRETEAMEVMWPVNFQDTFHPDGLGYVHGPPEPEQQPPQDQLKFTLAAEHFLTTDGVGQASSGEVTMLQCCGSASGVPGAEAPRCSHRSAPSPSTGLWQDVSAAAETAIASRTSSNGNSQLGGSEDSTQKMPAAGSSNHTYTEDSEKFAGLPTCGIGLPSPPFWSLDLEEAMASAPAASVHGDPCAFDPVMSYKIYHARQDDEDGLQAEADGRRPQCDSWENFNCTTEFNSSGRGDGDRNRTAERSTALFNFAASTTPAVAVPLVSAPPPPPSLLVVDLLQLPGVNVGDASVSSPVFHKVDPPPGSTRGWIEQQQPAQQPKSTATGWWDALSS